VTGTRTARERLARARNDLPRAAEATETHSIAAVAAAEHGRIAAAELALSDCAVAYDRAVDAATEIVAQLPKTPEASEALATARKAGEHFTDASFARNLAWARARNVRAQHTRTGKGSKK
jgi:hypothetical protein